MVEDEARDLSVDELLGLIDMLGSAQQEQLRRRLDERSRKNDLGSATIGEDVFKTLSGAWRHLRDPFGTSSEDKSTDTESKPGSASRDDLERKLQGTCKQIEADLKLVREAVRVAISVEKLLDQQLQKDWDQAETWQNRASVALEQGNDDLRKQALERKAQHLQSASELEDQLCTQRKENAILRQQLTQLEGKVLKHKNRINLLLAREKVALAIVKVNQILSTVPIHEAEALIAGMEQRVAESESTAGILDDESDRAEIGSEEILKRAIATLGNATAVISRLEQWLLAREAGQKPLPETATD